MSISAFFSDFLAPGMVSISLMAPTFVLFRYVIWPLLDTKRDAPKFLDSRDARDGFFEGARGGVGPLSTAAINHEIASNPELKE
jgi:hypothetical protein